ncbi:S9 family peptidase [Roseivirga pacifica]|uniref:S9 family peptidase n=1 Tax=Roseivirga pacifica TaxID=1267423 RepID=UPI0020950632|nr:S9 family peptidase [Roseivirga pacifica]MCO6360731.1 prolyl oligopeptidase family serine peptidase [Roseivirga pacifica]MCO6368620.1 prolyl oligopeptidase family serine peptidase [Roseivirga pacifica]MCO6372763.1 prolyl oligopeptidase family serine peptidase [Roseivirga pacifica]MCO6376821.1 prolyl oligopeptidase family serine peptidase [Roseivirga pacifica]MCO6377900.1 prolyl oligopeptidase family serine peptidase [Roseivirga pacifica]
MRYAFALATFLLAFGLVAQEKSILQNIDVFELEWVTNPQISPDGKYIVYQRRGHDIMTDRATSKLWIMNIDGSAHRKLTDRDKNESNPTWSPNGSKLAFASSGKQGSEIFIYDFEYNNVQEISALPSSPGSLSWSPNGDEIAFSMFEPAKAPVLATAPEKPVGAKWADPVRVTTRLKYEADGRGYIPDGFNHYYIIPADGGTARKLTDGDFNFSGAPVWTKDGSALIFTTNLNEEWDYDFRNSEIYKLDLASGNITALTDRNGPDRGAALSPDGKTLLYTGYDDRVQTYQITEVYQMNVDGSGKKEINLGLDRSVSSLTWAADGKGFYFMYDDRGNTRIGYHELKSGKTTEVAKSVGGTSIGRPYGGGSYSIANNGTIVYTSCTPYRPADVSKVVKGGKTSQLTDLNKDFLDYRNLGKVEEVWYRSSFDNREVQGWIITPPNFDPNKKYPLLVENHGGPISNYGDRFSMELQLFAADGYVVFYPNPRGSTSYGEEFGNLLYHNYPGNDYDDVMSGVDAMIEKGYIDQDQLYVTGGSAGGIMTAWMIGKNNRFRSAAVVKPVMNWISKTLMADNYYGYANSRFPGQPWENIEAYMGFSPISLVGNIQTPTLVMVGMEDRRTPPSEAKQLYGALKIRKIPTALVELPGAYHGIANRPSQLIAKVDNILAWFRKYR